MGTTIKERAINVWVWARDHNRFSTGLAFVLVIASLGAAFIISQLPPPDGQECGKIVYGADQSNDTALAASMQVLSCFWRAYQHCQPATVSLAFQGIDTSGHETLTVEQKDQGCDVYIYAYGSGLGGSSQRTFRCARMLHPGERLHLSNCDNNEQPFDVKPISPYFGDCGQIGAPNNSKPSSEVEQCFSYAYVLCDSARLGYVSYEGGITHTRLFSIEMDCTITYFHDQYQATCDSLILRDDGLHFFHCGNDGDIVVPTTALPPPTPF